LEPEPDPEQLPRSGKRKKNDPRRSSARTLGDVIFILGVLGLLYFYQMDTTVPLSDSEFFGKNKRIHNIGLMQERQNGLILSGLAVGVGVLCSAIAELNRRRN
jgi:hypothetical protein